MKNIKINKVPDNTEALAQYFLMDNKKREKSSNALKSMENPSNIDEAINFLEKLINDNDKFSLFLKLNDNDKKEIFSKIIYKSLSNNTDINNELEIFHRKALVLSTQSKVNAWLVMLNYANDVYKRETPANNLLYKWWNSDKSLAS